MLTDPRDSGLASYNDTRGGPGRIHVYVRDVAAATEGVEGMGMQVVDGAYEDNLVNVLPGDVIRVTGDLTYFGPTGQFTPTTVEVIGDITSMGLDPSILDPVLIDGTDVLNVNVGEQTNQVNWANYPDLINQYVRIEGATILRRTLAEAGRPNWNFSTDGGTTFSQNDDISLRYRNDRIGAYPNPPWNTRDAGDPFVPPAPGSSVNLQGFVIYRGAFEAFDFVGQPAGAFLQIAPFTDADLEVLSEPTITNVTIAGPDFIPGEDPVTITVEVEAADPSDIASVEIVYTTSASGDPVTVAAADQGDGTFTADIPFVGDGVFVSYNAVATDGNGAAFESTSGSYRILTDGIDSIEDIQLPADAESSDNGSPFAGITTALDITGTVQTVGVLGSNLATIQSSTDPWSGIVVQIPEGTTVAPGDVINITEATILDGSGAPAFDVTQLGDVTLTVTSTGGEPLDYLTVPTSALQDAAVAQAHQSMLLRFEDVTITNADAGFGEWAFSSDGTEDNEVLADDQSPDLAEDFAVTTFTDGAQVDFIQGIWWYSFGNYKLAPAGPEDIGAVDTDIEEGELPGTFALDQNYPNPFNPATTIQYTLGTASDVKLAVFDVLGRKVATLVDGTQPTGTYEVTFEAADLPSGLYLYRLETATHTFTRSMMLLK